MKLRTKLTEKQIKELFIKNNLDYRIAVKKTGLSIPVIYKFMQGRIVSTTTAFKIAKLLNMKTDELFQVVE